MKKYGLVVLFLAGLICYGQVEKRNTNSGITSCLLVEKSFMSKSGDGTEIKELYLSCSIQDYYIKICESAVTREELSKYIGSGIGVKMEIIDGTWDICDGDPLEKQSRTGRYVIIHSIE